jgi:signal transduction histidine kinase
MSSAFRLLRPFDVARAMGASAFNTWPLVAFGFGMMLCLGGVVTVISLSSINTMRASVLRLTDASQSRREHIDALRSQMYVSSILIRDYLLDDAPERLDGYRTQLRENRDGALEQVKELGRLASPQTQAMIKSLAAEVQAYWLSLDALILGKNPERPMAAYEHVRSHVIPRRQAVITLAEELADLNSADGRAARADVDRSIGVFQERIVLLRIITTILAAALGIFTTLRVLNLERTSRAEHLRVERAEAEMRNLSQELVSSQETERRALSRELHDDVGQVLTGMRFGLLDLEQHCVSQTAKFSSTLANCRMMLEQTIESIRNIAMGLRPSMLDDLGLGAAIEWQAREFSKRFDIPVTVNVHPDVAHCPEPHRTALYRVVQEALTNCARHARAKSVSIELIRTGESVSVAISDDGVGLPTDKPSRGFGLVGMEERVREIGGNLLLDSTPHAGTTLRVRVPLDRVSTSV